ncbi:MAG: DNA mismatch repair protein MutS [Meiothermus sp.]|uniref:MutS-related protein n=1 Tax=Meiothermus sp. TaxID=1955249 RepID=UPI0025EB540A|nr:DNA mismatch repair protein MutS [Meiothermus sp.]MCS7058489.1 DNA mismatch repair protein MutS [Meiothermus sp.]MCS7195313.1 DNA mismatch repair protein MutS [Meiothermus sp.]MCX7741013.1 DNA mismatch repair protein MutS [Meiothermus sp.]MDW8091658.1 DNA mismatch repair protein MutS [Meiothermus sp.]MDW8480974.1 DNA mismatch repair protein MutS [Meiothermus sp.]
MKVCLLFPERDFDFTLPAPRSELQGELTLDLGLDVLWAAMAQGDSLVRQVVERVMLSSLEVERTVVVYRQGILRDFLQNTGALEALYALVQEGLASEKKARHWAYSRSPSSVLLRALEVMGLLLVHLRRLRAWAEAMEGRLRSQGLSQLVSSLRRELDEAYLREVEEHLEGLAFRQGVLLGAELGPGLKGMGYRLLKPKKPEQSWWQRLLAPKPPAYTFTLHPRDESGFQILREIQDRGLNTTANALAQSVDHILGFLNQLRSELAFYLGALRLYRQLEALGVPLCFPEVADDSTCSFQGLCDLALALRSGGSVVGNDLTRGSALVVITGANQGGKTTFLRSVGQGQLMLQSGLFVGASSFTSGLCKGIYTHFKREEDAGLKSGKFDEELSRMSRIVEHLQAGALVLLNESFASTYEPEGAEVAYQVVRALMEEGVRVYLVSHMYSLTHRLYEERQSGAVFLRAERRPDGSRSFRILPGAPQRTSYGEDIYQQVFGSFDERTKVGGK